MKIFISIVVFSLMSCQQDEGWKNLLDKDLSKWDTYLSYSHPSLDVQGPPIGPNGDTLKPVGLNKDPKNIFSMVKEENQDVLRISGEIYGCLTSIEEYENYHLSLEVKWGSIKWPPRLMEYRDSGICYHSIGDFGTDYWLTWMQSQELQIGEGWFGDYWSIAGSKIDIRAKIPEDQETYIYDLDSELVSDRGNGNYCMRSADNEKPFGDWNTVELICFGDKSLHIINGKVVMALENSRTIQGVREVPLTKGKIQIQSEAAEVFYKNIKIRNIQEIPSEFMHYFY